MEVRYEGIAKRFGATQALEPLHLRVPDGTFLAMLGPSGCGKTTALRLLAGLETPTAGRLFIGERDVTFLEPKDRDVAMVFQSYALYPHKSVADNIGYPLRVRKIARTDRRNQVEEVARLLEIDALLCSALRDPAIAKKYRWLPAIADAVDHSVPKPKTPDEPKLEDILGTHLNTALVTAIKDKRNFSAIAKKELDAAAKEVTSYLKEQGGYF